MTARRITGRAAAMATITVLFAGAAAAAAGGVLPGPFSGGTSEEVSSTGSVDPTSTGVGTSEPTVTDPSLPTSTDPTDDTDGTTSSLPEAYGLCTAWNSGHEKKADNPAFSKLQHAADEMDGTVDEYCDQVFADKDAARGGDDDTTGSTDVDDDSDDDTEGTEVPHSTDDHAGDHGSQGSGNSHGHGPKG